MSWIYQARIAAYLRRAGGAGTNEGRGRNYENLLAYLISSIPGCEVTRNALNHYGTEEADLAVSNMRLQQGLPLLPENFLVECKNWSKPVDSTTLGYFVNVMVDRGCSLGVLAAANGITGHRQHRDRAYAIGAAALIRHIRILVITTDDLRTLTEPGDLATLLHRRNSQLTANGTIYFGP
ncbi:restriction endonuclease [Nonomuraea pusilla]|uniref:restriction endonuclease n=1 Tax=Nonomuraea pusilla TaxID=46177 RepID=UPI0015A71044